MWVLLGLTGFDLVFMGFTGFLLSFTGFFYWSLVVSYRVFAVSISMNNR